MIDDFMRPRRSKDNTPGGRPKFRWQRGNDKMSTSGPALESEATDPAPNTVASPEVTPLLSAVGTPDPVVGTEASDAAKPSKRSLRSFWAKIKHKKRLLLIILACLILTGGVAVAYEAHRPAPPVADHTVAVKPKPKEPPKPTTEPSRLTGVHVAPELNKRPVTGVMIENSPDARPQSGLKDAGMVFEAIAEGGITRFLALFEEAQPDNIGPIRSARPYYLDWLLPFDASLAHVGGSPDALNLIKSLGVRDLDQFANGGSYHRISTRFAPHNVYTGMGNLDALEASKGFTSSTFKGFARRSETPSKQPNASSIDFNISGFLYNPHYDYIAATNSYNRSEGGKPHVDEKSGAQLSPNVVVALVMNYGLASDGQHSEYTTSGSGPMYVFQDGTEVTGTWSKAGSKDQFVFTDAANKPLLLNPGQTWISVVANTAAVTYK